MVSYQILLLFNKQLLQNTTTIIIGMVTIILNDYPVLKYVLIGIMGLFVLTNKES